MKKQNIFKKVDELYTKLVEKIIGDTPPDTNLTESLLTMGTPESKDVHYEKVVKKERREVKKDKALKKLAKLEKKAQKALKKEEKKKDKKKENKKEKSKN